MAEANTSKWGNGEKSLANLSKLRFCMVKYFPIYTCLVRFIPASHIENMHLLGYMMLYLLHCCMPLHCVVCGRALSLVIKV